MPVAKPFKSICIDLEKRVFLLNGEEMPKCISKMELVFEDGEWSLRYEKEDFFSSRATNKSTE